MYVFLLALPALESICMKSTTEIKLSSLCYYKYVKSEPWKYILITVITLRRTAQASD